MNDTWMIMRDQFTMWHQEMQVSCNWDHVSRSDCLSQWYQDEFSEDQNDCWLEKLMKCSWCMSISQICKFLLTIYTILLEDCMISSEFDKKNHEIFIKYHMQTCF